MAFDCMRDYIETVYKLETRGKEDMEFSKAFRRFSKYWEKTRTLYTEAGMSKGAIATMFAYDLNIWLKEMDFYGHTVSLDLVNEETARLENMDASDALDALDVLDALDSLENPGSH